MSGVSRTGSLVVFVDFNLNELRVKFVFDAFELHRACLCSADINSLIEIGRPGVAAGTRMVSNVALSVRSKRWSLSADHARCLTIPRCTLHTAGRRVVSEANSEKVGLTPIPRHHQCDSTLQQTGRRTSACRPSPSPTALCRYA